jgi:hypothetical protein
MSAVAEHSATWSRFAAAVEFVRLADIPVCRLDRCAPRTEQARQARELFRRIGVRGVSVTAPRYSQAHSVDVRLPRPGDDEHNRTRWPHAHSDCCGQQTGHTDDTRCPACAQVDAMRRKVEAILYAAFPNHRDRSEYESDHFDFCWSIQ